MVVLLPQYLVFLDHFIGVPGKKRQEENNFTVRVTYLIIPAGLHI